MATDAGPASVTHTTTQVAHEKLPRLPNNAKITKRPLHRPAIPSAYTSAGESKVVYVSAKTPFMSAIKRVEKLLRLIEKRDVQSATATVRNDNPRKRKRAGADKADEIASIAEMLSERRSSEDVIVKGTGKAISKALEIGAWFQQRPEYTVKLRTGTIESIDDIEIDDPVDDTAMDISSDHDGDSETASKTTGDINPTEAQNVKPTKKKAKPPLFGMSGQRDETRIRAVSVVEVHISAK